MKTTGMNFIEAVEAAKDGRVIRRACWRGQVYGLYYIDSELFFANNSGTRYSLLLLDALAGDWEIVDPEPPALPRLIAAAPELLEALEHATKVLCSHTCNGSEPEDCTLCENIARYKQLIAKAKGETE